MLPTSTHTFSLHLQAVWHKSCKSEGDACALSRHALPSLAVTKSPLIWHMNEMLSASLNYLSHQPNFRVTPLSSCITVSEGSPKWYRTVDCQHDSVYFIFRIIFSAHCFRKWSFCFPKQKRAFVFVAPFWQSCLFYRNNSEITTVSFLEGKQD